MRHRFAVIFIVLAVTLIEMSHSLQSIQNFKNTVTDWAQAELLNGLIAYVHEQQRESQDLPKSEKSHLQTRVSPQDAVELLAFNEAVNVETDNACTTEAHNIRSAQKKRDFNHNNFTAEHTTMSLERRQEGASCRAGNTRGKQRITFKFSPQTNLNAKAVKDVIKKGEDRNALRIADFDRIEREQAKQLVELYRIAREVAMTAAQLKKYATHTNRTNSTTKLRLPDNVHTDIRISDMMNEGVIENQNVTLKKVGSFNDQGWVRPVGVPFSTSGLTSAVRFRRIS